jgi:hypothetical protein
MLWTGQSEATTEAPEALRPSLQLEELEVRLAPCGCYCPAITLGFSASAGVAVSGGAAASGAAAAGGGTGAAVGAAAGGGAAAGAAASGGVAI